MSEFQIEIKNNGVRVGSQTINLDLLFQNRGLNPSIRDVDPFNYDTGLMAGGSPVKLRIWKKDGDYYWHLKKTRKLDYALTETNPLQILMNGERCLVKKAGGQFNQRAMIDVYSSNPEKNKYYLYSIAKVEAGHKNREVNEVATMVDGIKGFAERENLSRYLDNIGLPFYKTKDVSANAGWGEFFSHSYMVNGKNGTLTKDQTANRTFSLKEHRHCLEGFLLLIAAGYTHQDIKPDNIVRNENGYFPIDLGLGQERSQQEINFLESVRVQRTGRGTPYYMHPRVVANIGMGVNRARGDIYSLCMAFVNKYVLIDNAGLGTPEQVAPWLKTNAELNKNKVLQGIERDYPNDPAMRKALKAMLDVCYGAWVSNRQDLREKSVSELIRNLSIAFDVMDETLVRAAINKAGEREEIREQAIAGYLQDRQDMMFLNLPPQDQLRQLLSQYPIQEERVVALINSAGPQVLSFPSDLERINIGPRAMFGAVFQNKGNLYDALTRNKTRAELTELVKSTLATVADDNKQQFMEFVLRKELDKTLQQGFSTQTIAGLMELYPQFNLNALLYGQTFGQKIMRAALDRGNKALYDKLTEKGATLTSLLSIIPSFDVNTKNDLISRRLSLLMNHSPLTHAEAQEARQLAINTPECFESFSPFDNPLHQNKTIRHRMMVNLANQSWNQHVVNLYGVLRQRIHVLNTAQATLNPKITAENFLRLELMQPDVNNGVVFDLINEYPQLANTTIQAFFLPGQQPLTFGQKALQVLASSPNDQNSLIRYKLLRNNVDVLNAVQAAPANQITIAEALLRLELMQPNVNNAVVFNLIQKYPRLVQASFNNVSPVITLGQKALEVLLNQQPITEDVRQLYMLLKNNMDINSVSVGFNQQQRLALQAMERPNGSIPVFPIFPVLLNNQVQLIQNRHEEPLNQNQQLIALIREFENVPHGRQSQVILDKFLPLFTSSNLELEQLKELMYVISDIYNANVDKNDWADEYDNTTKLVRLYDIAAPIIDIIKRIAPDDVPNEPGVAPKIREFRKHNQIVTLKFPINNNNIEALQDDGDIAITFDDRFKDNYVRPEGGYGVGLLAPITMLGQFKKGSNPEKIQVLTEGYAAIPELACFADTRGDGNCYYRSVASALLFSAGAEKRGDIIKKMIHALPDDLHPTIDFSGKLSAEQINQLNEVYSKVMKTFLYKIEHDKSDALLYIHKELMANPIFDAAVIGVFKYLLIKEIKENPERRINGMSYAEMIYPDAFDIDEYIKRVISPLGEDARGSLLNIMASRILPGVAINIASINERKLNGTHPEEQLIHIEQAAPLTAKLNWQESDRLDNPLELYVHRMEGHYDAIYTKRSVEAAERNGFILPAIGNQRLQYHQIIRDENADLVSEEVRTSLIFVSIEDTSGATDHFDRLKIKDNPEQIMAHIKYAIKVVRDNMSDNKVTATNQVYYLAAAAFKLKKIDLSIFKPLLTEDMVFTGDSQRKDMKDFLDALEQAPVQALLDGNVAEQLVQQCLDACRNGPANQHKINQLAPLFFDKINVLIDYHKDAVGNRDVNLSVFLTDMLHVSYKKNHLSRAQFAQSLALLQAPENQIETSNFFENELIKQQSQLLLNENIVRELDNEPINELPRMQPEELQVLRDKATLLLEDSIANKKELIEIGLQLIKNDPDLYEYKEFLSEKTQGEQAEDVSKWIDSKQFENLIETDMIGNIIGPNDSTLNIMGLKISGFGLTKQCLERLKETLESGLSQFPSLLSPLNYMNNAGEQVILNLPEMSRGGNNSDKFDEHLSNLLKNPHPYLMTAADELLKPISTLLMNRNRILNNDENAVMNSWNAAVKEDLDKCVTKYDVMELIYRYTLAGSTSALGEGVEFRSEQETTYKLTLLMGHFWKAILTDQERRRLMALDAPRSVYNGQVGGNTGFVLFFEIVTSHGAMFGWEKDKFYTPYSRNRAAIAVKCLDIAQKEGLKPVLKGAKDILSTERKPLNGWGLELPANNQNAELEKIDKKRASLVEILESEHLSEALKYGCSLQEKLDGTYDLYGVRELALNGEKDKIEYLCNQTSVTVTTPLLNSFCDGDNLSPDLIALLISFNPKWNKYDSLESLITDATINNFDPPLIVVQHYCNKFPDGLSNAKFNDLRQQCQNVANGSNFNHVSIRKILASKTIFEVRNNIQPQPNPQQVELIGDEEPQIEHVPSILEFFLDIKSEEDISLFVQKDHLAHKNTLNAGLLAFTKAQKKEAQDTINILFDEYKESGYTQHDNFYNGLLHFAEMNQETIQKIREHYDRLAKYIAYPPEKLTQLLSIEFNQGSEAANEELVRFNLEQEAQQHLEEEQRQEQLRQEQLRQEQLRQEQLRQEQLRQEQLRQEQLRQEQLRQEQLRQEQLRQEQLRQEQLRQEQLRQEQLRQEQLRQEQLRQEQLRQEQLRQEELRQEEQRQEELRQEELRQEELRQEELRQEELRQEELRQEELRQEELRQEELRQEAQQRLEASQRIEREKQQRRKIFISSTEKKIDNILDELSLKIGGIDQHHFKEAVVTATRLLNALQDAKINYLTKLNNLDMNIEDVNNDFEKECKVLFDEARPVLERDLDWGTYLTNLLKAVVNAITWVASFGQANSFFSQERAESIKTVEEIEQKLKP
jgi:uncharacterized protein YjbI with pentapeptide repeats